MFRRRSTRPDSTDASAYSRRAAIADSLWAAQDRLRSGAAIALVTIADVVRWPFERTAFTLQERLVWPLADRASMLGRPARALSTGALILLGAGAGVAGLVWATPDRSEQVAINAAATTTPPPLEPEAVAQTPAEPTLQGAAPVFKPAAADPAEVDPAKAVVKSSPPRDAPASSEGPAEEANAAATASAARASSVNGPPAGPAALRVARDFATAFLSYETGDSDSSVRKAFGATATPALAKALLRRPPRLPANVEVPEAKVLNVVPAPSQGDVYPVSVSLLRVGLTSELRLEMEEQKGGGWRVTNVLG